MQGLRAAALGLTLLASAGAQDPETQVQLAISSARAACGATRASTRKANRRYVIVSICALLAGARERELEFHRDRFEPFADARLLVDMAAEMRVLVG